MIYKLRLTCIVLLIAGNFQLFSQNTWFFSDEEWEKANTAANANYLSEEEKEVFRFMNLARLDGERFYDSFINEYVENNNKVYSTQITENNRYLISLKKELFKTKGLKLIVPFEKLFKAAEYHATDMGKSGLSGHDSSDGTSFPERVKRYLGTDNYVSENCCWGPDKGIDIVCQLLLDNEVPSLGHRKNILNPEQHYAGVSIRPHKEYDYTCVIDFYSGK